MTVLKSPMIKLNTGYEIPLVGFGTYKIRGQDDMNLAIDSALQAGYRHFDTALLYANEEELGTSLKKLLPKYNLERKDIFITTKYQPPPEDTAETVNKLVENSLRLLGTEYLDLILIHYPKHDTHTDDSLENIVHRKETWLALEKFSQLKVRSIGVSNYEINHIKEIKEYSNRVPAVNQVEYHPHFTRPELKKYCKENGIFFQAFSSFARQNPDLLGDPVIVKLTQKYNISPQILLLSFATSQNVGVIPKSGNPDRIISNFKVLETHLSDEDITKLNNLNRNKNYIRPTGWLVK